MKKVMNKESGVSGMNTRTVLMILVIVAAIGGMPWLTGCGSSGSRNMVAAPISAGEATIVGNVAELGQTYAGLDSVGLVVRLDNVPPDFAPTATIRATTGESKTLRPASLPGVGVFLAYDGMDLFTVEPFSKIEFSTDLSADASVEVLDRNADNTTHSSIRANLYGYRLRLDVSGNGRVDTNDLALIQGWIQAGRASDTTTIRARASELYPALSGNPLYLPVEADDNLKNSGIIDSHDVALTMAWIQIGRVASATLIFDRAKEIFPAITAAPERFPGDQVNLGFTNYTTVDLGGGVEMTFARISSATFSMGSNDKLHTVTITRPYNMAITEVTQRQYQYIMGVNPARHEHRLNRPVDHVSWNDAVQFCNMLSVNQGLTPCYTASGSDRIMDYNANGFRLPTEAEWEYASRGISAAAAFAPMATQDDYGWSAYNCKEPQDVAQKLPNAFGLYDMFGNLQEWVWDWYGNYPTTAQTDPLGPDKDGGHGHLLRGGDYGQYEFYVRKTHHERNTVAAGFFGGFRVVLPCPTQ